MKKEKILKDEQGNDIASPRLSDNPSEEGEVKVCNHRSMLVCRVPVLLMLTPLKA